jgi:hypothetical protein
MTECAANVRFTLKADMARTYATTARIRGYKIPDPFR